MTARYGGVVMNKHRHIIWTDDGLRLQEVVPDGKLRVPQPQGPQYPNSGKSRDAGEDTVVALSWPRETGWRSH